MPDAVVIVLYLLGVALVAEVIRVAVGGRRV